MLRNLGKRIAKGGSADREKAPPKFNPRQWAGADSEISRYVAEASKRCLNAYRANPLLVDEHASIERATAEGGYGRRQIYELVQNAADALLPAPGGRIRLTLTKRALYCANEGRPLDKVGIEVLLHSHLSTKRGLEIGRFGLGFKSVLGVTTRPEVYSRSGSFGFDDAYSAEKIKSVVPTAAKVPVLRLARPLKAAEAAQDDLVLKELMAWAQTVVKLPRDSTTTSWLSEDLQAFPAEFLLFCPHVGELVLDDRAAGTIRTVTLQRDDGRCRIREGQEETVWRVFERDHTPTDIARADAGELADRPSVRLMWAVPVQGRSVRGRFWAFFPTEYVTTLSGIANAPWKTNEDRQNLLTGPFNRELIGVLADLIVDSLPQLVDPEDPGSFLELLPARGREAPNWADSVLTDQVYDKASRAPSVPDLDGRLRAPAQAELHPPGIPPEAMQLWLGQPDPPRSWCHPTVDARERRPRIERLFEKARKRTTSLAQWLEVVVRSGTPQSSVVALTAAAVLLHANRNLTDAIRQAAIVLTSRDRLIRPVPGAVFIAEDTDLPLDLTLVHRDVGASEAARTALEMLGVGHVEVSSALQAFLVGHSVSNLTDRDWERFWSLARNVPVERAVELVEARMPRGFSVKARTLAGSYELLTDVLLPGPVVSGSDGGNRAVTIDTAYHASEIALLERLGAVDAPRQGRTKPNHSERWFLEYSKEMLDTYYRDLPRGGSRPDRSCLVYGNSPPDAGPLGPMDRLDDGGRASFTERLIMASTGQEDWIIKHRTIARYPVMRCPLPSRWAAERYGRFHTSLGPRPIAECVAQSLEEWSTFLPVVRCSAQVSAEFGLPGELSQLDTARWNAALGKALCVSDLHRAGAFYAAACQFLQSPPVVSCNIGGERSEVSPGEITAVWSPDQQAALDADGIPHLPVPTEEAARLLVDRWGLKPPQDSVRVEVLAEPSGAETTLSAVFPGLPDMVLGGSDLVVVPCLSLRKEVTTVNGTRGYEQDIVLHAGTVFYRDHLGKDHLLDGLSRVLGFTLTQADRRDVLDRVRATEQRRRLQQVREQPSLGGKLLAALGAETIRRQLPVGLVEVAQEVRGEITDAALADIALAVNGTETLRSFRQELKESGFDSPVNWAGTYGARAFVRSLGFPKEFAGFEQARRDPLLAVDGPSRLPPLHDFQLALTTRVRELLTEDGRRRGMLSLPTGAGKTRVAVQALVEAIAAEAITGPVLWVAQSDELCEQAVQAWYETWRSLGPPRRLYLNRLWSSNDVEEVETEPQVVVATIQKLQHCIGSSNYEWLSNPSCLVIDEAHGSTETTYTALLNWVGLGRRKDSCPLLGLTATPFRGVEDETKRLASRFGIRRLDEGLLGDDPYAALQKRKVLAEVDQEVLPGVQVRLSDREMADLIKLRVLPPSAQERLAANVSRNKMILESLLKRPPDWPILLFAASVEHAQAMAALLALEGVPAASISAYTDPGARRYYVEQFRAGKLRVLTNYGVLTTGFDAPAVRAVFVTRPTYSPVLYQQMIGRGLRGPLNGGKERCLIVNVEDNIAQFKEALAFRQFEHLWRRTDGD